jgi:AraC-like DNA-binding protein
MPTTTLLPLAEPPAIVRADLGFLRPGPSLRFQLPCWALHAYTYEATLRIGGQIFPVRPGTISLTPALVPSEYVVTGPSEHAYIHFLPGSTGTRPVPLVQHLHARFSAYHRALLDVIGINPLEPRRAVALLWELLWQHAQPTQEPHGHPVVRQVLRLIDRHLHAPLTVMALAQEANCSSSQLLRLFRQHLGCTVAAYGIRRRLARAHHLLCHSNVPIRDIAHKLAFPNIKK